MQISIQCFGQVRSITKERFTLLEVQEGDTITKALDKFVKKFGEELEKLLYNEGRVREFYFIQLDKENIKHEDIDSTVVKENQIISIIPFISGG